MSGHREGGTRTTEIGRVEHDPVDLFVAARRGDDWAVEILYRGLQPDLLRYLRSQVGSAAEDLASDVWVGVAKTLPHFVGGPEDFRKLLFTIGRRRVLDERRRLARDRRDGRDAGPLLAELAGHDHTDLAALSRVSSEAALAFVDTVLPADQAEILLLRVVAGLSAEETAAVTGRRPGTVRVMQHRALRRLSKALEDTTKTADDTAVTRQRPRAI